MKHIIFAIFLLILPCLKSGQAVEFEEFPQRRGYVNDFADMLSPAFKEQLEAILKRFKKATTHDLVVATFQTHGDEPLPEFARRLAVEWNVWGEDSKSGIVIMFLEREHTAWIEVGLGLDQQVPYLFRRKLIRTKIAGHFRDGDYDSGTFVAAAEVIKKIAPSYSVPALVKHRPHMFFVIISSVALLTLVTLGIDYVSYALYLGETHRAESNAYWQRTGVYSFLEWWLLYGLATNVIGFFNSQILFRWLNPAFLISAEGTRSGFLRLRVEQGRFWGNGTSGKW